MKRFLLALIVISLSACFRTQYTNFDPVNNPVEDGDPTASSIRKSGIQPFFVWGLVPGERVVHAMELCKGTENITAIKTKKTFGQVILGLFVLTDFIIYSNLIFTPRSGAVYCSDPVVGPVA
ncbi:MAG TPA: hypothetical protein PKA63_09135 [Oligoflexia bacterium]|nr:hypothetical protein [Oligoflexia bacterium]HMP48816.1 hypothetical protein [Oligoflexia bacterium]